MHSHNTKITKKLNRKLLARTQSKKIKTSSRVALLGFGLLMALAGTSAAVCPDMPVKNPSQPAGLGAVIPVHFETGSLIIPMDNCYQRADKVTTGAMVDTIVAITYEGTETTASAQCDGSTDSGQLEGYGLIQRLVEDGVPVHWALRDGKPDFAAYDFMIAGGASPPVEHMTTAGVLTNPYTTISTIRYAGAPFIIDIADVPLAKTKMALYAATFPDVSIHEAKTSFDAPIYKSMGAMPKVAILDLAAAYLNEDSANLVDVVGDEGMSVGEGVWWNYLTIADVVAGTLVTDSYDLVWVPSFSVKTGGGGPNAAETIVFQSFMANMDAFAAAGGSSVVHDEAIEVFEGTADSAGVAADAPWMLGTNFTHTTTGVTTGFFSSTWTDPVEGDDYSDPAAQWGGGLWSGIGGAKANWSACDSYRSGVRRMVYTLDAGADDDVELASWKYHNNDSSLGRSFYLGGNNWRKNTHTGLRLLMNTIFVTAVDVSALGSTEASRSAPILALADEGSGAEEHQFFGTFDVDAAAPPAAPVYGGAADDANFEFPASTGHFRAIKTSAFTLSATEFDGTAVTAFFDTAVEVAAMTTQTTGAGCGIDGACRHIFTNIGTTKTPLVADNLNLFKADFGFQSDGITPFTDPEATVLMQRIHAGKSDGVGGFDPVLGGIDRSTVAVIETSPFVGTARAKIAYVGGTDGMMHAICAEGLLAPCVGKAGREIWAFMPRSQLGAVASNTTRIDGSPKVSDVFADFGSGTKIFKTVLTFQSGTNDATAAYALDISDPTSPTILWEHATPGGGMGMAMGVVLKPASGLVHHTFIQSSTGTSGAAGMYVAAIETATGTPLWSATQQYDSARGQVDTGHPHTVKATIAIADVPNTAIPAGVTIFASDGGDVIDTVLVPSLWGAVWALDANDGGNQIGGTAVCTGTAVWQDTAGCTPLFQFVDDYHPIGAPVSVYVDQGTQQLRAVVVTGGFTDHSAPSAALWAPDAIHQFAVSFATDAASTDATIDAANDPSVGIHIDFLENASGVAFRAFSQAVILGNEIFITSDSGEVNGLGFGSGSSGQLTQVNLGTGVVGSTTTISNGSASVEVSATSNAVYTGAGSDMLAKDIAGYDTNGSAIEATVSAAKRFLWLRQ